MSRNDTQAADEGADAQIYKHALLSVARTTPEGDEDTAKNDDTSVGQKARRNDKMLHLLNIGDRTLLRSVHHDNDATNDAHEAANFSDQTEALLEEDGGEDGSDNDGQGTKGGDEDRIGESVGDEIADFAYDHESHAEPPPGILQISIALACFFVVLVICFQQANLLDHEGSANEEAGRYGKDQADDLVDRRTSRIAGVGGGIGRIRSDEELVSGTENMVLEG